MAASGANHTQAVLFFRAESGAQLTHTQREGGRGRRGDRQEMTRRSMTLADCSIACDTAQPKAKRPRQSKNTPLSNRCCRNTGESVGCVCFGREGGRSSLFAVRSVCRIYRSTWTKNQPLADARTPEHRRNPTPPEKSTLRAVRWFREYSRRPRRCLWRT